MSNKIQVIAYKPGHLDLLNPKSVFDGIPGLIERVDQMRLNPSSYISTLVQDQRPIAVVGLNLLWSGVAEIWSVTGEAVRLSPLSFHKTCLRLIESHASHLHLHRIQMTIKDRFEEGYRWARSLGFEPECRMKHYGPDQSAYWLYARIF